ncbi:MAG: hypothetical protein AB8F78_02260 [Saprospiraceae bacterium]
MAICVMSCTDPNAPIPGITNSNGNTDPEILLVRFSGGDIRSGIEFNFGTLSCRIPGTLEGRVNANAYPVDASGVTGTVPIETSLPFNINTNRDIDERYEINVPEGDYFLELQISVNGCRDCCDSFRGSAQAGSEIICPFGNPYTDPNDPRSEFNATQGIVNIEHRYMSMGAFVLPFDRDYLPVTWTALPCTDCYEVDCAYSLSPNPVNGDDTPPVEHLKIMRIL